MQTFSIHLKGFQKYEQHVDEIGSTTVTKARLQDLNQETILVDEPRLRSISD